MRQLSHLKGIQAFEAAARHASFAEAARELNVTPAAVAQLVRSLETWLGTPLFHRSKSGSRRIAPTEAAQRVLALLSRSLDEIDSAMRTLREAARGRGITVSASSALATRWLIPHLHDFATAHPQIDIRLDVTDRLVDFGRREADIAIRCGAGNWPGTEAFRLMEESVIAVCSPALTGGEHSATPLWNQPDWVARQPFVEDTSPAQATVFPLWSDWLAAAGLGPARPASILRINSTTGVIQTVLSGRGIALVRRALVAQELATGQLLRCLDTHQIPFAWSYYCVVGQQSRDIPEVRAFADWLRRHWRVPA